MPKIKKENQDDLEISIEDLEKLLNDKKILEIKDKFFDRMWTFVIAGFGLITVLAWDQVFKDIFIYLFGEDGIDLWEKILYAVLLTLVITVVSIIFKKKVTKRKRKKKSKK